ncbi:MAG: hypothetical protein AABP62_30040 [Planctomycetota bacterium]
MLTKLYAEGWSESRCVEPAEFIGEFAVAGIVPHETGISFLRSFHGISIPCLSIDSLRGQFCVQDAVFWCDARDITGWNSFLGKQFCPIGTTLTEVLLLDVNGACAVVSKALDNYLLLTSLDAMLSFLLFDDRGESELIWLSDQEVCDITGE